MVQLTWRDEVVLDWLVVVRLADLEAIRWAMAGAAGRTDGQPLVLRKAQRWVTRMHDVGLIGRARPAFQAGSVVWPTHIPIGHVPNLFRQTTRHELAVAAVSARYLAHGYSWQRDRKPASLQHHQADGVAVKGDRAELVEVELTAKSPGRYGLIHNSHAERLGGEVSRVVYFATPQAGRVVSREADRYLFRDIRPRLLTLPVLDAHGKWVSADDGRWDDDVATVPASVRAPELWDEGIA